MPSAPRHSPSQNLTAFMNGRGGAIGAMRLFSCPKLSGMQRNNAAETFRCEQHDKHEDQSDRILISGWRPWVGWS
jgi:hypothetical protein